MGLSKETRQELKEQMDFLATRMVKTSTTNEEWAEYKKQYDGYFEMLYGKSKQKVSPDTLLVVGANLLGILFILNYEKGDTIVSKAMNFVIKGRV